MTMRKALAVAVLFVTAGLVGCGSNVFEGVSDSSGSQAQMEEGLAALDAERWDEAIEIFSAMDAGDPDVGRYLASAYVGKAGFDALTLVERIAEAQEGNGDQSVLYESVTEIFDEDRDGVIDTAELEEKMCLFRQALDVLGAGGSGASRVLAAVDSSRMTDTEIFQMGLYAAIHAVLGVVAQLDPPGSDVYLLTLGALRDHPEVIESVEVPQGFDTDLAWVREAVLVLSPELIVDGEVTDGNDLAKDLDEFLREIGYLPGEHVTGEELRTYLYGLVGLE